jgi:hypothetical protein
MSEKLLHESGGAQLKGAGSLARHEQRDSERNRRATLTMSHALPPS